MGGGDNNFLNKIKTIKTIKSDMPEIKEEQLEHSHDRIIDENNNNLEIEKIQQN